MDCLSGPDLDILVEDLEALGNRHGCFGVQPAFFHTLGVATMYGLRKCAGKDFTDEEEGSWKRVYEFLATNMVTGNQAYWKQQ